MYRLLLNIVPCSLILAGLVMFFLALFGKPKYALWLLVPLLPLQNVMDRLVEFPLGKDFNDILFIGMLISILAGKIMRHEALCRSLINKFIPLYALFTYITLWNGSSFLGDPAPLNPLDPRVEYWKNYMLLPLLFLLAANILRSTKDIKRMFVIMCVSMFAMNFYVIRQISWMQGWESRAKLHGTFVWLGANEVAAFYATYTFVLLGVFLIYKSKWLKLMLATLIFQNFFCVLFILSRGAYLASLAASTLLGFLRDKIFIILVIIVVVSWHTILPQRVIERMTFTEQEGEMDESAKNRLELWKQGLVLFKQSPIVGVGFNVFSRLGMQMDTHNLFFRTLAEQGIIGALFLLFIMMVGIKRGYRLYRTAEDKFLKGLGLGFCVCAFSTLVVNFFGDRWSPLQLGAYYWVFLGMVERGNMIADSERRNNARYA